MKLNDDPVQTSSLRTPFESLDNFRDVGGYRTKKGRVIKNGMIYRSDNLSKLTPKDLIQLSELQLKTICDLRSDFERKQEPNQLPEGVRVINIPIQEKKDYSKIQKKILTGDIAELDFRAMHFKNYKAFIIEFSADFQRLMQVLQREENYPILIHCNQGKDRTGFALAILFFILDIPLQTVFEDYLLSNRLLEKRFQKLTTQIQGTSTFNMSEDHLLELFNVQQEYLEHSLSVIKEKHGTIKEYLRSNLTVTEACQSRMQNILLGN